MVSDMTYYVSSGMLNSIRILAGDDSFTDTDYICVSPSFFITVEASDDITIFCTDDDCLCTSTLVAVLCSLWTFRRRHIMKYSVHTFAAESVQCRSSCCTRSVLLVVNCVTLYSCVFDVSVLTRCAS